MKNQSVAVIGAGPAGLFAAKTLAEQGVSVVILNRDVRPGGLAEYGIYPEKHKLKAGLRKRFNSILSNESISYFGNIEVGKNKDISLDSLLEMGFAGILVTAGAQKIKRLGLEGEDLEGVYHAWEIVSNYNLMPPFSTKEYLVGKRIVIIGVGNVMADIARYLITKKKVKEVIAVARRGPAEIKFHQTEFAYIAQNLNTEDFEEELERVTPIMQRLGQDPNKTRAFIEKACENCKETNSDTELLLRFLKSPVAFKGENGKLTSIELMENNLVEDNGRIKSVPTSLKTFYPVDTVIMAVGSSVDERIGLPTRRFEHNISPYPDYPVNSISYEVYDDQLKKNIEGVFVAGWSRLASYGLVGISGKDGSNGASALLEYIKQKKSKSVESHGIKIALQQKAKNMVNYTDVLRLYEIENKKAQELGLPEYKFATKDEMLSAIGII